MEFDKNSTLAKLSRLNWIAGLVSILSFLLLLYVGFGGSLGWGSEPAAAGEEMPAQAVVAADTTDNRVEDGIHLATGLIYADGFETVRKNCTACHSGKLVAQNKATREGWEETIRWMQATQGLWDLGDAEAEILDYLAANYAPAETGRRTNLDVENIEWYMLELK
ncbi:MAG TPA: hypothetical protein PKE06_04955 [Flavilitoribacter sp.]|nr:hypothetical protein [Flavilitoribacter sp.]HMQ86152.1 hypothetical protein [Flavilitoribacter sp.]